MEKDLISIVVPCYNVSPYLKDCLKSLDAQTYKKTEIIFINDGSTDNTIDILTSYIKNRTNAKIINQKNAGVRVARNAGIKVATGEFLYFLDPDDCMHPQILEILHNLISQYNADVAFCSYHKVRDNYSFKPNLKLIKCKVDEHIKGGPDDVLSSFLAKPNMPVPWNKLYRVNIVKQMSRYPNVFDKEAFYNDDFLFCNEYFSLCSSSVFTRKKLYYFRIRKGSITNSKSYTNLLSGYKSSDFLMQLDKDKFSMTQNYIPAIKALNSMYFINRLAHSSTNDSRLAKTIYNTYKTNLKKIVLAKKMSFAYRYGTLITLPVMYLMIRKKSYKNNFHEVAER